MTTYRIIVTTLHRPEGWIAAVQLAARGAAIAEGEGCAAEERDAILEAVRAAISQIARAA